jgi:arginyl-tRNA synthetase
MTFKELLGQIHSNISNILEEYSSTSLSHPIDFTVEPAKPGFGDISSNISFLLSKRLKQKPFDISKEIADKYQQRYLDDNITKVDPHPSGFLNFSINWKNLAKSIVDRTNHLNDHTTPEQKTSITIEHTSVNPNKNLHIGHVRNIAIGDSISRILKKCGYDVKVLNYIDDLGLQVADLLLGILVFELDPGKIDETHNDKNSTKYDSKCGKVYQQTSILFDNIIEEDKPIIDTIRKEIISQMEDKSSPLYHMANQTVNKILKDQLKTCWMLNSEYDCLNFESQIIHSGLWEDIFKRLKQMNIIEFETQGKNSNCWVFRGDRQEESEKEGKDNDKVIVRSNGTATYIAKDIPYAAWKLGLIGDNGKEEPFNYEHYDKQPSGKILWKTTLNKTEYAKQKFSGNKVITVIDSRQSRLQQIIKTIMSGFTKSDDSYIHLGYEPVSLTAQSLKLYKTVNIKDEDENSNQILQMSGRKGIELAADSVIRTLDYYVGEKSKERYKDLSNEQMLNKIIRPISIGVLRYEMIKQDLDKAITFDLQKSTSLEGNSAPYIQYTHARAVRILEKAESDKTSQIEFSDMSNIYEKSLIRQIGLYDIIIKDAANNLSPKIVARYCYELAVAFNAFYEHVRVIDPTDTKMTNQRICTVHAFKNTIKDALELLGISAPDRM